MKKYSIHGWGIALGFILIAWGRAERMGDRAENAWEKLEKTKVALAKIASLDDKGWVAMSHYDCGLSAAHNSTGSIARKALKDLEEGGE